ncbi:MULTISPECIES: helix-turn-helix domain-containing protein [Mycobacteroides]|uniref:helix-turn-helix domain-containing protein n=1 Tax=Mycobacteroides TaxID=670516 RepID=UPI001F465D75|nr:MULTISPECIES: helix-turn-helix transcriptional regulator [Mycobacteroides]MDO3037405.1 helix-turn-helix transcriptional regulator [Mycobacteroides abscessus subsp. abscessus]MDO3111334.1 helix-turn-helix transcriptional regulator [Mycobacteroides abscessus subsp. massiliense]MDO3260483.1 helix-turn-helix transcriptional regulator [Mycobacteroides abscessus subsp. abscessus]
MRKISVYELTHSAILKWRIRIDFNQYPVVQLLTQGGAILMTPEQTVKLIKLLKDKREKQRFSVNEVARRADVDPGTVWRIEQGMIAKPRVESLIAIGRVLGIGPMELFTTVGWLTADDLPDFGTYLNAKFEGISETAVEDIEHFVDRTLDARPRHAYASRGAAHANHCPQCPCAPKEC